MEKDEVRGSTLRTETETIAVIHVEQRELSHMIASMTLLTKTHIMTKCHDSRFY